MTEIKPKFIKSLEDQVIIIDGVRYRFRKGELVGIAEHLLERLKRAGLKYRVVKMPNEQEQEKEGE